jgi:hypothetical protein
MMRSAKTDIMQNCAGFGNEGRASAAMMLGFRPADVAGKIAESVVAAS